MRAELDHFSRRTPAFSSPYGFQVGPAISSGKHHLASLLSVARRDSRSDRARESAKVGMLHCPRPMPAARATFESLLAAG